MARRVKHNLTIIVKLRKTYQDPGEVDGRGRSGKSTECQDRLCTWPTHQLHLSTNTFSITSLL